MDAFSYLSVLLAVILGLALTQILQGFRGLLHSRERVVVYWPSLVWACRMRQAGYRDVSLDRERSRMRSEHQHLNFGVTFNG